MASLLANRLGRYLFDLERYCDEKARLKRFVAMERKRQKAKQELFASAPSTMTVNDIASGW